MTIALVTPLKDELENLPRLYHSISELTTSVAHWVICENGSTDGSAEYVASAKKPKNVGKIHILHVDTGTPEYQLGFKYSRIVETGLKLVRELDDYRDLSYIGILDADCFPLPDYYERLVDSFRVRERLGIVSGVLIGADGSRLPTAKGFPRGNSRLWRKECLEQAPYIVGMSADTLSAIRAQRRGWHCDAIQSALVESRDVGHRAGQKYYGQSAYYRGETLAFTVLKTLRRSISQPRAAVEYFSGYSEARRKKMPQVDDQEILSYSRTKLTRRLGFGR